MDRAWRIWGWVAALIIVAAISWVTVIEPMVGGAAHMVLQVVEALSGI